jgi:hypothetical protein
MVRPQVLLAPQLKFAGQSEADAHGLPAQRWVASQTEPAPHWLSAVQPGMQSMSEGMHVHATVVQMYAGPMAAHAASEVQGCMGAWQMPHPEDPPGGTQV